MPTVRQVWLLTQEGDYTFSIDLKHAYFHITILILFLIIFIYLFIFALCLEK